jgi:TolA-binding protein
VAAADKAGDSLLRMAVIYAERLKDADLAMKTYREIVRQFSGTSVAEDASWRIAQYHERQGKFAEAIDAYKKFLRNYRRSAKAGNAQFAVAENYEHLGKWVDAMDAYTHYMTNFASGPLVQKAKEQINWIKTYRL